MIFQQCRQRCSFDRQHWIELVGFFCSCWKQNHSCPSIRGEWIPPAQCHGSLHTRRIWEREFLCLMLFFFLHAYAMLPPPFILFCHSSPLAWIRLWHKPGSAPWLRSAFGDVFCVVAMATQHTPHLQGAKLHNWARTFRKTKDRDREDMVIVWKQYTVCKCV